MLCNHDGEPARAACGASPRFRPETRVADRVRLPDESARPVLRRLAAPAGAVHRTRRPPRVRAATRRHAHPVHVPRRAGHRSVAERALSRRQACRSRRSRHSPSRSRKSPVAAAASSSGVRCVRAVGRSRTACKRSVAARWSWLTSAASTSSRGYFGCTIVALLGTRVRVWSPDAGYGAPLHRLARANELLARPQRTANATGVGSPQCASSVTAAAALTLLALVLPVHP